jgi:hypothetical protein
VAAAFMPRLTKVELANLAKVLKPNPLWVTDHLFEKIFYFHHGYMIPLLIPLSSELKDVTHPGQASGAAGSRLGSGRGREELIGLKTRKEPGANARLFASFVLTCLR